VIFSLQYNKAAVAIAAKGSLHCALQQNDITHNFRRNVMKELMQKVEAYDKEAAAATRLLVEGGHVVAVSVADRPLAYAVFVQCADDCVM